MEQERNAYAPGKYGVSFNLFRLSLICKILLTATNRGNNRKENK